MKFLCFWYMTSCFMVWHYLPIVVHFIFSLYVICIPEYWNKIKRHTANEILAKFYFFLSAKCTCYLFKSIIWHACTVYTLWTIISSHHPPKIQCLCIVISSNSWTPYVGSLTLVSWLLSLSVEVEDLWVINLFFGPPLK